MLRATYTIGDTVLSAGTDDEIEQLIMQVCHHFLVAASLTMRTEQDGQEVLVQTGHIQPVQAAESEFGQLSYTMGALTVGYCQRHWRKADKCIW